jgi:hypothetical protein
MRTVQNNLFASTFTALGAICMPAPTRAKRGAWSYTCTSCPARLRSAAAASPPMPAPTIAIRSELLIQGVTDRA